MGRDVACDVAALHRCGECGVQRPVDVTDRLRGQRAALGAACTFEMAVQTIEVIGCQVLQGKTAKKGDDPNLDLLLVVGARRLADGEPAPQVSAKGVLADLDMVLMVDGGERFTERLFRLPARAEPTSGRLSPLHLAGVRVESRQTVEADPPPTTVLRLVAGDAARHHCTPGELTE